MKILIKTFPQLLLLLLGGVIVIVSLLSANRVLSQGEGLELTGRRFYFQQEVLPDHLLYPALAGWDRLRLAAATNQNKLALRQSFAWKRLAYTARLLERGYQALSFSTLTKAYKYYLEALEQGQSLALTASSAQALGSDAQVFQLSAQQLWDSFTDAQRDELHRLDLELTVLRQFYF
ncbi:MAG TPA: hypothetical protein VGA89_00120 [Patescibacteria group bacterium]|jgi:hypothetical protein